MQIVAEITHNGDALRRWSPQAERGELAAEERRSRVEAMAESEWRLLVATDCLSEGINLQSLFDTVVHDDLTPWCTTICPGIRPGTSSGEGRVDRFGQPARLVRSALLYWPDSAIDGAELGVILRKAEAIRKVDRCHRPAAGRARRPLAPAQPRFRPADRYHRDGDALATPGKANAARAHLAAPAAHHDGD